MNELENQNGNASILTALDKMVARLESNADRRAVSMKSGIILKVSEGAKAEIGSIKSIDPSIKMKIN